MKRTAPRPGDCLREELRLRGWRIKDLAYALGRPLPAISQILNHKKRITAQTAVQIGAALGTDPEAWMNLQVAYDMERAREDASDVNAIKARARKIDAKQEAS